MDDLTKKRTENEVAQLGEIGKRMRAQLQSNVAEMDNMVALKAEWDRRIPSWAGDLFVPIGMMFGFASARLRALGAPDGYLFDLLRAAIDDNAPRCWPQDGLPRPAWVIDLGPPCDCGAEHPGGARDLASQVIRLLLTVYSEALEVIASAAVMNGEIPSDDKQLSDEARDAENMMLRERTFETLSFYLMMIGFAMPQAM